jgi:arsenite methyltransferase
MTDSSTSQATKTVKQCCARLYESDIAKILLGDSFHPGGLLLTERLGTLVNLTRESRALDVASGPGTSALFLAERFGCEVVGVDYSAQNVERANELAATKNLSSRVHFELGDAERLRFPDASFDAVICECAFCTLPDKSSAAREFARVLRQDGHVGISDLTPVAVLPEELNTLLAWISCIADAQPIESYASCLRSAGLDLRTVENHDAALVDLVREIRMKLLSAEVLVSLKKLALPNVDFTSAKQMAASAVAAVGQGQLGYVILVAARPTNSSRVFLNRSAQLPSTSRAG